MSLFGLLAGLITLLIIGLGFPLVIYSERIFGYTCWPYLMGFGILLVAGSLVAQDAWVSVVIAVTGATFAWGATELKEQAVRAELGWFPLNRNKLKVPFSDMIERWKAPHL